MGTLWHRTLRTGAFIVGGILVGAMFVFAYSNTDRVNIDWTLPGGGLNLHSDGVVIWWLVLVPLAAGILLGYLYAWPARFHHYAQHMRHRRRVHELEKEVRGLNVMLDRVREVPEDGPRALPPAAEGPLEAEAAALEEPSLAELAPESPEEPEAPAPEPEPEPALAGAAPEPTPAGDGDRRRRRVKLPAPPAR